VLVLTLKLPIELHVAEVVVVEAAVHFALPRKHIRQSLGQFSDGVNLVGPGVRQDSNGADQIESAKGGCAEETKLAVLLRHVGPTDPASYQQKEYRRAPRHLQQK